jgi:predicted dehydrogenase
MDEMTERLGRRRFLIASAAAMVTARQAFAQSSGDKLSAQWPKVVRVGMIGLDGHYSEITAAARAWPAIRVTAIAERDPGLRKKAAQDKVLTGATMYEDHQALLEREKLDVVAVCGQNGVRASVVRACVARGIPVVAEKPLALSLADLEAVERDVRRTGVPLTMLLPMRFNPVFQEMKRRIGAGEIGEVVSLQGEKSYQLGARPEWMKNHRSFGGIIPFIGTHLVDLMRWVSGREFVAASAFQSNVGFPQIGEMENNATINLKLDNHGTALVRLDYLRPASAATHGDDRVRIAGTKGVIEYREGDGLTLVTDLVPSRRITDLPPAKLLFVDFLDSLYQGNPHLIERDDVFRVTEIVLKAREAAESGRVVRLTAKERE